jgi:antitoxin component YwqK of YwqJK toxin-antitoxin module
MLFKDCKKDGLEKQWYVNGQLQRKSTYKDGKKIT